MGYPEQISKKHDTNTSSVDDENGNGSPELAENVSEESDDSDIKSMDNDHQTEAESSGEPPGKRAKIFKKDLYRPPTNEELNQLKETQNLFHSSLFRLQVPFFSVDIVSKNLSFFMISLGN